MQVGDVYVKDYVLHNSVATRELASIGRQT